MIGPPQGPAIWMDCQEQDTRLLDSKIMLCLLLQMSKMGPEHEEGGFVGEELRLRVSVQLQELCPLPVCAEHFEHSQFMNVESKYRLVWNAVPTKFSMPNPPPQVSSKRPPPTWIKDWATTSNSTQQEIQEQSTNRLWFWYVILKNHFKSLLMWHPH